MLVLSPESLLFQKSCRRQGKSVSPFSWYQQKGMKNFFSLWEACRGFQQLQLLFPERSRTDSSKENKKALVISIPVSKKEKNEQGERTDVIQNRSQTNY